MKTPLALVVFALPLVVLAAPGPRGLGRGLAPGGPGLNAPSAPWCPLVAVSPAAPTTLAAEALVAAVEEERMAHDLYVAAAAKWPMSVFQRLALAEAQHEAALTQLAASIQAPLPAAQPGVYATAELQQMYAALLPLVNGSLTGALKAGALVEETELADLRRLRATATDEPTRQVLLNLEQATARHLTAFARQLAFQGVTYTPEVLTPDEYAAVLNTTWMGRRGGGRGCLRGF